MSSPEPQKSGPYLGPRGVRSEDAATCRRWKQDVSSQSGLVSPYAHQISRRSVNIPPHPHNMNTPHASYPIDRSCSSLKCKRAAPIADIKDLTMSGFDKTRPDSLVSEVEAAEILDVT